MHPFRQQAFNIMNSVNVALMLFALSLASWHQTWEAAFFIGLPALVVPYFLYKALGDHTVARLSYGVAFMLFCALHIHQSNGVTEIHFGIFVLLAVLSAFRDWLVIVTGALTIAVHHLLFAYLQNEYGVVYLVPTAYATYLNMLVHASYVVVESIVLIITTRTAYKEAMEGLSFSNLTKQMVAKPHQLDLRARGQHVESKLVTHFNEALDGIQQAVQTINSSVVKLHNESAGVLDDSEHLVNGMNEQSLHVQRIAAATEEMAQGIQELGSLSASVLAAAQQAEKSSMLGKEAVDQTIESISKLMKTLQDAGDKVDSMALSTKEITAVLEVIQSIAEQTNLLALNAAIEAARAGEQGRGFAVVADEVRVLAGRTRNSTEQIKQMIINLTQSSQSSVNSVKHCLNQVEQTVGLAKRSDDLLDQIAQEAQSVAKSADIMTDSLALQLQASAEMAKSGNYLNDITTVQMERSCKVKNSTLRIDVVANQLAAEANRFQC